MIKQKKENLRIVLRVLAAAAVILLEWYALERSITPPEAIARRAFVSTLVSICTVAALSGFVGLICGRLSLTLGVTGVLCALVSVANYYVNSLHGSPLRISEIASFGTAMDVIGGFRIQIPPYVRIVILGMTAALALLILLRRFLNAHKGRVTRLVFAGVLAASVGVVALGFSGQLRPFIGYSWDYAASLYGYPACLVEDTLEFHSRIIRPEGYSAEKVDEIADRLHVTSAASKQLPDVILILNETFYDPAVYEALELEVNRDYLAFYHSLNTAARGYAVVPYGGTNSSEYEMLTSNSRALINPSAPFNIFDLSNANSVVSYLQKLGYETWAMHSQSGSNYSRSRAYAELGFDHILFQDDFAYRDKYGNRYRTDAGDYKTLIDCYEASQSGPRFLYILTYQNHGGYEQNPSGWDTIHTKTDLGELTDDMDEFLTSIAMSDAALKGLLDYFKDCGRPVVVIMAGDHPPAFVTEQGGTYDAEHLDAAHVRMNGTPYLVWYSDRSIRTAPELITLSDLVPMALKMAGVPLSVYYQAILNLQRQQPVHVSGLSLNTKGAVVPRNVTEDPDGPLNTYLYLEYNNLQDGAERRQALFDPPGKTS